MTNIVLEILFAFPTLFYFIEDKINVEAFDLPHLVQWDMITVMLPFLWAYTVFLYRWVYLFEDLSLLMLIQVTVGTLTAWGRYQKRFTLVSSREAETP